MSTNIISEHWRRGDETIEIVELSSGNSISVFIKDGEAIIFSSIWDFAQYNLIGGDIKRIYCSEDDLENIYDLYDSFYKIPTEESDKNGNAKNYKKFS